MPSLRVRSRRLDRGALGQRYGSLTGYRGDPWWDLHGLAAYSDDWQEFIPVQVAGRRGVDVHGMAGRVEDVMRAILSRM